MDYGRPQVEFSVRFALIAFIATRPLSAFAQSAAPKVGD